MSTYQILELSSLAVRKQPRDRFSTGVRMICIAVPACILLWILIVWLLIAVFGSTSRTVLIHADSEARDRPTH